MLSILSATYQGHHTIRLRFSDGVEGVADVSDDEWKGVLKPLENEDFFRCFVVDHGTIVWSNGVDIAPEFFYYKVTGHYPEEQE
jgi:hypothetical protein